jgi:hypothetical protein
MVSAAVHVAVCAALYMALQHGYTLTPAAIPQRYVVRMLELTPFRPTPSPPPVAKTGARRARPLEDAGAAGPSERTPAAEQASAQADAPAAPSPEALAAARLPKDAIAQLHAVQTMIVPDTDRKMAITRPLPQVMMWSSQDAKVSVIVAPPQPPSIAALVASLSPPNQEMHIADLKLSATPYPAMKPLPPPSNTAPVSTADPAQVQQMVMALAQRAGPATPTDVIVVSDVQLQSGVTAAPVFNAVARAAVEGSVHPGSEKGHAEEGTGVALVAENGSGDRNGNGSAKGLGKTAGSAPGGPSTGERSGAKETSAQGGGGTGAAPGGAGAAPADPGFVVHGGEIASGAVDGDVFHAGPLQRQITKVMLPKDGRFGVVVIGNSTADEYPETVALWRSRIAYSVYLQVGTTQKWVLQYALPSAAAASPVRDSRVEAPWPYDIERPSIDADAQSDAIIVHGSLNTAGHLERLAVVFPEQLSEAAFLVHTLELWAFRPALRNGQPTAVDVLLIIPAAGE